MVQYKKNEVIASSYGEFKNLTSMEDSWRTCYKHKEVQHIDHHVAENLMNTVLNVREIIEMTYHSVPLSADTIEKKIKRLQWRWKVIKDHYPNFALPIMTGYKKTFRTLTRDQETTLSRQARQATGIKNIETQDNKTLYFMAKPFLITVHDVRNYLTVKYRLHPRELEHIARGIKISRPSTDKSALLFVNFDEIHLYKLLTWLNSDELRYRPGGLGFQQVTLRFQDNQKRLEENRIATS